ncbi:MAG: hypothetical protein EPN77_19410 [Candidimonas sp.]|nr:MAG: hypothetical protein EPN77_19410 [Candidimonas sp.]
MTKQFNAVRAGTFVGREAKELQEWIEAYVRVLFPEAGIEYWACDERGWGRGLRPSAVLPDLSRAGGEISEIVCYVREGCESPILEVAFRFGNGQLRQLTWAKIFDTYSTCWKIAAAVSEALHSIFEWREIPMLVDIAAKLPRAHWWEVYTSIKEPIVVQRTDHSYEVRTAGGLCLDSGDFQQDGPNARFRVQSLVLDWSTVLTNMKAEFSIAQDVPADKLAA